MGFNSQKASTSVLFSQIASPWLCGFGDVSLDGLGSEPLKEDTSPESLRTTSRSWWRRWYACPFATAVAVTRALSAALPVGERQVNDTDYELRRSWNTLPDLNASFPKPGRPAFARWAAGPLSPPASERVWRQLCRWPRGFYRKYYLNTEKDRVSPVRSYKSGFHFLSCIFSPCKPWEKM